MKCRTVILLVALPFIFCCWCFVVPRLYRFHPVYNAIMQGDMAALKRWLQEHPGQVSHFNGWPVAPLGLAAEYNDTNMMAFLLDQGAPIEGTDNFRDQCTALHCAAIKGNVTAIAFLLSRGANVNSVDRDNETPLHYAAQHDQANAAAYLIGKGANINARSFYENRTPLEAAVSQKRLEVARVLLEHGANADFDKLIAATKSEMDWTPLAPQALRDQSLKTIALLQEFQRKRTSPALSAASKSSP
jgi:ankyrin repeat protein